MGTQNQDQSGQQSQGAENRSGQQGANPPGGRQQGRPQGGQASTRQQVDGSREGNDDGISADDIDERDDAGSLGQKGDQGR